MSQVTAAVPAAAAPVASSTAPVKGSVPVSGATTTPEVQAPPRMLKLKLDGKEVEMTEQEVISYAQQGKVATQRFQEAQKMRQEAEQLLQFAKQNPKEFFNKTGMNARQWAEQYLMEELTNEAMSPEQRKARENEEKLRTYESEKKQAQDKQAQEQRDRLTDEHRQRLDLMFTKALTESGLPRNQFTVKRMAELQLLNIKNKYELDASQLAKLVREDYQSELKSIMGSADGNQLMDFLGADNVKKLSKAQIAQLKARANPSAAPSSKSGSSSDKAPMSWNEYRKANRKR
jgi:hypothetical protein